MPIPGNGFEFQNTTPWLFFTKEQFFYFYIEYVLFQFQTTHSWYEIAFWKRFWYWQLIFPKNWLVFSKIKVYSKYESCKLFSLTYKWFKIKFYFNRLHFFVLQIYFTFFSVKTIFMNIFFSNFLSFYFNRFFYIMCFKFTFFQLKFFS